MNARIRILSLAVLSLVAALPCLAQDRWPSKPIEIIYPNEDLILILAGLLVGFGARLGSGCTSGHGVCGLSRLSLRSIFATGIFMLSGFATVALMRGLGLSS